MSLHLAQGSELSVP
uniref:Uncharacterized protein n=1 Tax=Anguilla anguilla TaxID=7936 RepID=A0A0E9VFU0_ANGAN